MLGGVGHLLVWATGLWIMLSVLKIRILVFFSGVWRCTRGGTVHEVGLTSITLNLGNITNDESSDKEAELISNG